MMKGIPQRWRLLSGQNKWNDLLNPLDSDLQQYIIHYGAMAGATYDTFNSEKQSKYTGSSRYSRRDLFSRVGLVKGNPFNYKAVKYIYATSSISLPESFILKSFCNENWCRESNWIGYVAVATDEGKTALGRRDILVAWRGTMQPVEYVKDFDFPLVSASTVVGGAGDDANVHQGILSLYTSVNHTSKFNKTSARDQVLSEVRRQMEQYKDEEISITITGHSLGASLSTLNAADIVCNGHNQISSQPDKTCPVTAFNFGILRVGDSNFRDILESRNDLHILSILNDPDIVPHLPPAGYTDIGVELRVDSRNSPFLNYPGNPLTWHNLEAAYLHPVAIIDRGTKVERDIALVNKHSSALKDEYLIPPEWWCEQNKGMVQMNNGSWQLQEHEEDDNDP